MGDNKKTVNQKFNSIKVEIWPELIRLRDFVGRMITDFPARAESMATMKYYHGLKFPLITLIREITKKRKESPKHLRNGLFPYFLWIAELTAKDRTEAVPTLNFVWFIFIVSPGEKLNQGQGLLINEVKKIGETINPWVNQDTPPVIGFYYES